MKKWVVGDNGKTKWSTNCNYPNANKFNVASATKIMLVDQSKCSAHCLSIKRCTHFGWIMGTCWVKDMRGVPIVQTVEKLVPICGFVPVRKPFAAYNRVIFIIYILKKNTFFLTRNIIHIYKMRSQLDGSHTSVSSL